MDEWRFRYHQNLHSDPSNVDNVCVVTPLIHIYWDTCAMCDSTQEKPSHKNDCQSQELVFTLSKKQSMVVFTSKHFSWWWWWWWWRWWWWWWWWWWRGWVWGRDWINECMSGWMDWWMNGWTGAWMNKWKNKSNEMKWNERMNEWMNEWMDEPFVVLWYYEIRCDVVSCGGIVWFG